MLSIYDKISRLGIIEKYIFYKRAHNLRAEQKKIDKEVIQAYFSESLLPKSE